MSGTLMQEQISTATKKATWKDFTLEEHLRAQVGVPTGCVCIIKTVNKNTYRVNVVDVNSTPRKFVKSEMLKVIESPEGYIFEPVE